MDEVTCPRCEGRGDIPAPGGSDVTKCFACGGHGVIDKRDLQWQSKWAENQQQSQLKASEKRSAGMATKTATVRAPRKTTVKKTTTPAPEDTSGRTPLHREASDGFARGVKELLEGGADPNARDADGRTPLHWPAYRGHTEVVRLLLDAGADINARDNNGRTPLKMAMIGNHTEVINLLRDREAEE